MAGWVSCSTTWSPGSMPVSSVFSSWSSVVKSSWRDLSAEARRTLQACRVRGLTVATAESCTGGLIAGVLTEIAGSSDVVERGFVTYSNAAKRELLGVRQASLLKHGAVSEIVAREMAEGAR